MRLNQKTMMFREKELEGEMGVETATIAMMATKIEVRKVQRKEKMRVILQKRTPRILAA